MSQISNYLQSIIYLPIYNFRLKEKQFAKLYYRFRISWRIRWDLNPGLSAFFSRAIEGRRALWLILHPCCATDPFLQKKRGEVD